MLHRTGLSRFIFRAKRVHTAPINGYEVSELPNERIFEEYMRRFGAKQLVVAVLHSGNIPVSISNTNLPTFASPSLTSSTPSAASSGASSVLHPSANHKVAPKEVFDPIARSLVSGFNLVNLGHPDDVKIVTVPATRAPTLCSSFHVVAYPTTLLFFKNSYIDRVVGCRFDEVATKSLFTLRNNGMDIYSAFEYRPTNSTDKRVADTVGRK